MDRASDTIQFGPGPILSPTKAYEANAYYEPYGGATGGVVWVEITYHNDEEKQKKTIYYSPVMEHFEMQWITEDTLSI